MLIRTRHLLVSSDSLFVKMSRNLSTFPCVYFDFLYLQSRESLDIYIFHSGNGTTKQIKKQMSKQLWNFPSFSSAHFIGTNSSSYKMSLKRQRALANVIFYQTQEWFLKRFWSQLSGEVSGLKISWFLKLLDYFLFFR